MRLHHPLHPGRKVWLGYCHNLHSPDDVGDLIGGLEAVTVPVRDRILGTGSPELFGVGLYLPAALASALVADDSQLAELRAFLGEERLVPFTFNAFPYGGFQSDGLKERVFQPTWAEAERLDYTRDVARVAAALFDGEGLHDGHVSISTHPGAFGAALTDRSLLRRCAEGFGRAVAEFAQVEADHGVRLVLGLEAEPRASAGTSRALAEFMVFARTIAARVLREEFERSEETAARLVDRHLGTCLDACHAAVEFEAAEDALRLAHFEGPLAKLQVSSALSLVAPGTRPEAVDALLAMDEPRYLHQTTGLARGEDGGVELLRVDDLSELRDVLEGAGGPAWRAAEEWRCHFHVPVDRESLDAGLATTRAQADELVRLVATDLAHWHAHELHLEIETYTWSVLPGSVGGLGTVVDGLEREYRHVLARLEREGWDRAGSPLETPKNPG